MISPRSELVVVFSIIPRCYLRLNATAQTDIDAIYSWIEYPILTTPYTSSISSLSSVAPCPKPCPHSLCSLFLQPRSPLRPLVQLLCGVYTALPVVSGCVGVGVPGQTKYRRRVECSNLTRKTNGYNRPALTISKDYALEKRESCTRIW